MLTVDVRPYLVMRDTQSMAVLPHVGNVFSRSISGIGINGDFRIFIEGLENDYPQVLDPQFFYHINSVIGEARFSGGYNGTFSQGVHLNSFLPGIGNTDYISIVWPSQIYARIEPFTHSNGSAVSGWTGERFFEAGFDTEYADTGLTAEFQIDTFLLDIWVPPPEVFWTSRNLTREDQL